MLNASQRWIIFCIFCVFAVAVVVTEIYLVVSIVENKLTTTKVVVAVLNFGVLIGMGRLFQKIVENNFLKRNPLSSMRLHDFASERMAILEEETTDLYAKRQKLITATLRFAEECLQGWIPGSHIELCVFVDAEEPLLYSYFDSNRDTTPRSAALRQSNFRYYREKGYQVTHLLQSPTSYPQLIGNTEVRAIKYVFTTENQRKQLKSSALFSLDLKVPCALVVSSNAINAFHESDADLMSFLRFVGTLVRQDLFEGNFISTIRSLRPELFAAGSGAHQ